MQASLRLQRGEEYLFCGNLSIAKKDKKMNTAFTQRLNKLRGNMNVSEFARFLGIRQSSLDCYIKGERKPSVELVVAVCLKCDVSSDWLLGLKTKHDADAPDENVEWKTRALNAERKLKKVADSLL